MRRGVFYEFSRWIGYVQIGEKDVIVARCSTEQEAKRYVDNARIFLQDFIGEAPDPATLYYGLENCPLPRIARLRSKLTKECAAQAPRIVRELREEHKRLGQSFARIGELVKSLESIGLGIEAQGEGGQSV